jgi:hypothetical protein
MFCPSYRTLLAMYHPQNATQATHRTAKSEENRCPHVSGAWQTSLQASEQVRAEFQPSLVLKVAQLKCGHLIEKIHNRMYKSSFDTDRVVSLNDWT